MTSILFNQACLSQVGHGEQSIVPDCQKPPVITITWHYLFPLKIARTEKKEIESLGTHEMWTPLPPSPPASVLGLLAVLPAVPVGTPGLLLSWGLCSYCSLSLECPCLGEPMAVFLPLFWSLLRGHETVQGIPIWHPSPFPAMLVCHCRFSFASSHKKAWNMGVPHTVLTHVIAMWCDSRALCNTKTGGKRYNCSRRWHGSVFMNLTLFYIPLGQSTSEIWSKHGDTRLSLN